MKKSVKALLVAACALCLVAASIFGTVAYLTKTTGPATNTFTVGKLFDNPEDNLNVVVLEHKALDGDGTIDTEKDNQYTLDPNTEVNGNEYKVLPGVDIPKDPFIRINNKVLINTYLFIEVVDKTADTISFEVDTNNWTATGLTGDNDGDVYALKANDGIVKADQTLAATYILKDNKLTVSNAEIKDPGSISVYVYMIQAAGFTDANDAFTKGFLA